MSLTDTKSTSCGGLCEHKRPDRGDPDGGDSENGDSNCEKNDSEPMKTNLQDLSETKKHPTFNLPSPFKAIDLRNIYDSFCYSNMKDFNLKFSV